MKASSLLWLLVIASMIGGCSTTTKTQQASTGNEYRRFAEMAQQKKNAEAAEDKTLKKLPEMTADEYERLGDQHVGQGNVAMALIQYGKALRLNARNTAVRYKTGRLFIEQGRTEEAMKEFEEILRQETTNGLAHYGKGLVFLRRNELDKSQAEFCQALALSSTLWQAHASLGIIYDRLKQYSAAIDEYNKALTINPQSATILNDRGMSRYLNGEYEESIQSFIAAGELDPGNTRISNNLGLAFARSGRFDEAFETFNKARDEASAQNNMGYIYMMEGDYAKAQDALQRAENASPTFYVRAHKNAELLQELMGTSPELPQIARKKPKAEPGKEATPGPQGALLAPQPRQPDVIRPLQMLRDPVQQGALRLTPSKDASILSLSSSPAYAP